jgi:nicotinamidase-related amidase
MPSQEQAFLDWLEAWEADLPTLKLEDVAAQPERVAVITSDLIKGFCCVGPLASPRIKNIIPAVVRIFEQTHDLGVRHFLLTEDTHDPDAVEFSAYPPHAVAGSEESETIDELMALPFSDDFVFFPKNSTSATVGTDLIDWLETHPQVTTFIIVGDCTDICVYQLAIDLRVRANVLGQEEARIIIPANAVQTFDTPVDVAEEIGAMPHDGDLLHTIFLYHMALNGVEVAGELA